MKKSINIISAFILMAFTACNGDKKNDTAASSEKIEITHELGKTSLVENPQKIVVFDMGTLETLDELGIKVAGLPKKNLPSHLKKYAEDPNIVDIGTMQEPNFEKINALGPEAIFVSNRQQAVYGELSKIAPTVYFNTYDKDYMSALEIKMKTLGQIFKKEDELNAKVAQLKKEIETSNAEISKSDKKGLILLYNKGKFSAYGKGSRFGFIHDVMGVKPAIEDLEVATHGQPVSNELILKTNPDYIFIVDRNAAVESIPTNKSEIENVMIQKTNAFKNGKITYLDAGYWYLSGGGTASTQQMIKDVQQTVN